MTFKMLSGLLGGIGLFLLGMRLMTEGFRFAAGHALHNILARSTATRLRGLLSGTLITSVVQSSGAVTVATIGFVNAGMMHLSQAVSVIYGSNIGTTMTGWLVALFGFKFDIKILALPAVGIGMLIRILAGNDRRGALGEALAGFGLFFIGIHALNEGFAGLGRSIQLEGLAGTGLLNAFFFVGIGFLLTFLMQSSSAAIAVALTAATGGVVSLEGAAAIVIGANVGTTSTAGMAALGATPNAKRVAAAHVLFNVVTGAIALLLLPLLLHELSFFRRQLGMKAEPAVLLASFHTLFNLAGVLLFFPLTNRLVATLKRLFRTAEEDEARPRYLDRTVLGTPSFAIQALAKELGRIGAIASRMGRGAMSSEGRPGLHLLADKAILDKLVDATADFSNLLQRTNLPPELDTLLPSALRVSGYYTIQAELALVIAGSRCELSDLPGDDLQHTLVRYQGSAVAFLEKTDPAREGYRPEEGGKELDRLRDEYHNLKAHLLKAGTRGQLSARRMVDFLELIRNVLHMAEQAEKGARYLESLQGQGAMPTETEESEKKRAEERQ
jgi:phosphate:Na+ symporter